jgi:hypothetical protein
MWSWVRFPHPALAKSQLEGMHGAARRQFWATDPATNDLC